MFNYTLMNILIYKVKRKEKAQLSVAKNQLNESTVVLLFCYGIIINKYIRYCILLPLQI